MIRYVVMIGILPGLLVMNSTVAAGLAILMIAGWMSETVTPTHAVETEAAAYSKKILRRGIQGLTETILKLDRAKIVSILYRQSAVNHRIPAREIPGHPGLAERVMVCLNNLDRGLSCQELENSPALKRVFHRSLCFRLRVYHEAHFGM